MAQVSLPYTLQAGQPENVNQLVANLDALVTGVNTVNTAQIADANVTTAKIADSAVTADKLGSTLAGQLGVSQTGTDRSVTVTQTAEITNTALATVVTSSNLTVAANGLLRIVLSCELKNSGAGNSTFVQPEIDTGGGTWLSLAGTGFSTSWGGTAYSNGSSSRPAVIGTTYKAVSFVGFISSNFQTSSNAAALRVRYEPNAGTAYLKNLTATMTYIAV